MGQQIVIAHKISSITILKKEWDILKKIEKIYI